MKQKGGLPHVLFLTLILALLFWIPIPGLREFAGFKKFLYFIVIGFLDAVVLSYLVLYSKWSGWKLIASVFVLFYGVMTFMSQIETVVFLNYLQEIVTRGEIPRLFIEGIIIAGVFSPLAVFVYGRNKKESLTVLKKASQSPLTLVWKFLLVGVVYMFVYLLFGAFVFKPLAGEAFNQFYGSIQLPAWILPFQVLRGVLWGLMAFLILKMMREWKRARLMTALLFSVIMGTLLLAPNPYMPEKIRLAHFVEVSVSNFIFGWIAVTILAKKNHGTNQK
ncbi:MAG TPA: hypothetical protein VFG01_11345 [Acidobacteriota bacterium]|nr:hypothetical protein [Acidobacteriota bacterium]